jgi:hypothetical protein
VVAQGRESPACYRALGLRQEEESKRFIFEKRTKKLLFS